MYIYILCILYYTYIYYYIYNIYYLYIYTIGIRQRFILQIPQRVDVELIHWPVDIVDPQAISLCTGLYLHTCNMCTV